MLRRLSLRDVVIVAQANTVQADCLTYKVAEFVRGDLSKSFESGYLGIGAEFFNSLFTLFV